MKAGADGFLFRRDPPSQLLAAVRIASGGGAPLPGPVALKVVAYFHKREDSSKEAKMLSPKEREVLGLLAMGFMYREIGVELNIGTETVRSHVKGICRKLNVRNRIEAIAKQRWS